MQLLSRCFHWRKTKINWYIFELKYLLHFILAQKLQIDFPSTICSPIAVRSTKPWLNSNDKADLVYPTIHCAAIYPVSWPGIVVFTRENYYFNLWFCPNERYHTRIHQSELYFRDRKSSAFTTTPCCFCRRNANAMQRIQFSTFPQQQQHFASALGRQKTCKTLHSIHRMTCDAITSSSDLLHDRPTDSFKWCKYKSKCMYFRKWH